MENLEIAKHIGKVFYENRLKNKLTQNQVAELAGLEPRYVGQIERGISKGSIDTLLKLCNVYKITPDMVLYELLDNDVKNYFPEYENDFRRLNQFERETVLHLMKFFLSKQDV